METITAIRTLRVVRKYEPKPLTEDEVRLIADSARKTGSSKNTQRWDFITIRDPESLRRLGGTTIYAKHLPYAGAAIALIVDRPAPDYPRSVLWDLGRAAQNITLTAWEMGIGSCPITVQKFGLAADVLGLPDDKECQYIIALGWPADPDDLNRPPRAGGRKSYDEVVHDERWGQH
ncbi:MAG: nitroreductase family protein [Chloroflexota bacterium]|jgi:nitroreductase